MAKEDERRIGELEKGQARIEANQAQGSKEIGEHKQVVADLAGAVRGLAQEVGESKGSYKVVIGFIVGFGVVIVAAIAGSSVIGWNVNQQVGLLVERTATHKEDIAKLKSDVEAIKIEKASGAKSITDATAKINETIAKLNESAERQPEQGFLDPTFMSFVTLASNFALDSSEGESVLVWDIDISSAGHDGKLKMAAVTYILPTVPATGLPPVTADARLGENGVVRIRLAMKNREAREAAEKFFKNGGVVSIQLACYVIPK